ncbi:GumC family protein [Rubellicoccus peritrichatus]|uniref:AAA family ATPase n=1 Tax=Rubellicoccus peritrichatus TaxID=3080537 RepID=A0AAQ3L8R8_9BACT|nr:AAA family ATPase [Puniceicoccus sp. CR14]WOO41420.1 AAA family ATPase [Puniceicoccus sp. CR14]
MDLLYILLNNWWIIAICVAITGISAVAYLFWVKPIYRATARVEIFRESRIDTRTKISYYEHLERTLQRQSLLMRSDDLHKELRNKLSEKWSPIVGNKNIAPAFGINEVRESRGTMVDIDVDSINPQYALAYLESMLTSYKAFREQELREVNDNAVTGLRSEEQRVLQDLEEAKTELEEFENDNQVLMVQEREQMDAAFLNQLMARLKAIRMERTILENQHEEILNADAVTIREALEMTRQTQQRSSVTSVPSNSSKTNNSANDSSSSNWVNAESVVAADSGDIAAVIDWEQQEEQLADMENAYKQKLEVFLPTHPEMIAMKAKIDGLTLNLQRKADVALKRFHARFQALKMQEEGIEEALSDFNQEHSLSAERRNRYHQLKSRVSHLQKKYNLVYSRLLENSSTPDSFFMRVIKPAHVIGKPISPQKAKILIVALGFGFALGGGIILLRVLLKPEELRVDILEADLHIPCVATIPNWEEVLKPANYNPEFDIFVVKRGVNQAATEIYRGFRHKLDSFSSKREKVCLAVTSPKRGDGKTFNTLNLAVPYAWDGRKVLVIDGDFRRARLTNVVLGERPEKGFTDCLLNPSIKPIDRVQPIANSGIDILPAGKFDETVPEKTKTQLMQSFIAELHQHYDIILIDTAPVNIIVETVQICRAVDGVILFSDANGSRVELRHAMRDLQGIKILGFCLNGVTRERVGAAYGNYGGYASYGSDEAYLAGNEEAAMGLKKSGRTTRAPWSKKTLQS